MQVRAKHKQPDEARLHLDEAPHADVVPEPIQRQGGTRKESDGALGGRFEHSPRQNKLVRKVTGIHVESINMPIAGGDGNMPILALCSQDAAGAPIPEESRS